MNHVDLMGRLVKDPDVRYSQGEKPMAIASFTIAVDRRAKKDAEQTADFISIKAFGKNGEFAEKFLKKGTKVVVSGRIQTGSYTNKDGNKVYTTDVVADEIEFAESKGANGSKPNSDGFMDAPAGLDDLPTPDFMKVTDGDLPFDAPSR